MYRAEPGAASSLEQPLGRGAVAGRGIYPGPAARNLRFEGGDPRMQFVDGKRIEILQTQKRQRVARSLRQVIIRIHGTER